MQGWREERGGKKKRLTLRRKVDSEERLGVLGGRLEKTKSNEHETAFRGVVGVRQ